VLGVCGAASVPEEENFIPPFESIHNHFYELAQGLGILPDKAQFQIRAFPEGLHDLLFHDPLHQG